MISSYPRDKLIYHAFVATTFISVSVYGTKSCAQVPFILRQTGRPVDHNHWVEVEPLRNGANHIFLELHRQFIVVDLMLLKSLELWRCAIQIPKQIHPMVFWICWSWSIVSTAQVEPFQWLGSLGLMALIDPVELEVPSYLGLPMPLWYVLNFIQYVPLTWKNSFTPAHCPQNSGQWV